MTATVDTPDGAQTTVRRNEWLLVFFTGTTSIADAIGTVALPVLMLHFTRSPLLISAVATLRSLPWLLGALHIGVVVDRLNRRQLMVAAEIARTVAVGTLLAGYLTDLLTVPQILVTALVLGVAEVFALLAGASIVPAAVPLGGRDRVNTRMTGVEYLCHGFVGAPFGGLLVAAGFGYAFGTAAAVYVVGAVLLMMLVGNFAVQPTTPRGTVHGELRDGLRFLLRHRLLRTMSLLVAVMAGSWAVWYALIAAYAIGALGLSPGAYGLLLTCLGAGGIVGVLLVGRVNRILGRRWSMFVDIIGTAAMVGVPAVLPQRPESAWIIGAAAFLTGIGGTMWTVNSRVIQQALVPNEMFGRFSAATRLVSWGMAPVAALLAGGLAQLVSYRVAFGVFGVACLVLVIPFLRVVTADAVRDVDRPSDPAQAPDIATVS
ncbi:MFS transporter [Dactylosporangium matsuzakiense]|uniref:MFS transporter n=1 Tax=Dactylosporangium matsuzakiense TaxID=53360 RepID=A0A9W6KP56_9ACTN|nr:MFS transporter [Dactylosporangium matsuzakiense]GLL04758.1 MFS transporter [Dactylosporangium matsuzakiense]